MLELIQRKYNERLTLGTLARMLGRQAAYIGRLFREEIGITVHEYLTRARMVYGALQVRSGVKIEAVALDLGYQSKKNFYRQFKRRFGMTPEAYRNGHYKAAVAAGPSPDARNNQGIAFDGATCVRDTAGALERAVERTNNRASTVGLRAQPMMVRALVHSHSPVAMFVTDGSGCYVGANKTAVSITGYSVDELRGLSVKMLLPSVSGSDMRCRIQILLPASMSLPANTVLHTKSGGAVDVHLTSAENLL